MKLGLNTAPFGDQKIEDVADWSAANGYEMLEICCWPSDLGEARRYAGVCHIDVADLSAARAAEIVDDLGSRGTDISGLGYYPNPLHPDADHRAGVIAHLKDVISAASLMGVGVVNTFMGADSAKTREENWADAKAVWPEIVAHAEAHGVRIAIENCPMLFSLDEWPSGNNLAHYPAIWRTMFEEFGETIGLNFDPSHLVWQMIDMGECIREFGERFYHVHAKDLLIDPIVSDQPLVDAGSASPLSSSGRSEPSSRLDPVEPSTVRARTIR
jgi:sugar phosphate isomerase/epimerase